MSRYLLAASSALALAWSTPGFCQATSASPAAGAPSPASTPTQDPAAAPSTASSVANGDATSGGQDIVVTAQRRGENIQRVPLSIVAITGPALVNNGINSVVDLSRTVPSLRLDTVQQVAGVSIRIRGIGSYSNAAIDPSVAPYLDGIFIPRPGAILSSFLDVDAVEVLRGPQGTLFGRNSTVGAISIRTVAPSFEKDTASIAGELGNFGERKLEGIANLRASDTVAFRIAGFGSHTDGWFHDTFDGKRYGRGDTYAGRVSAKVAFTPSLTWVARVDYASTTGDGVNGEQADVATASPTQIATFQARSGEPASSLRGPSLQLNERKDSPYVSDHQVGVTSDLTWQIGGGFSFRLLDSYRRWHDKQDDGDVLQTTLDLFNRFGTFSSSSNSHELQLLSPQNLLNNRLDFVVGLYYFHEDYSTTERFDLGSQGCTFLFAARPALLPACQASPQYGATVGSFDQHANSYAGYGQANYHIVPNLTFTAGVRYTKDHKTGDFVQAAANPFLGAGALRAPESTALDTTDDHVTYRLNLSWQITPAVLTYVSYSTGYKSGGFNSNGGAGALTAATRTFAPETSNDVQLGFKSAFFDRKLIFNADLFQTRLENFQDRAFNGITILVRNAGNIRARGLELDASLRPVDHLRFDLGAAYLDSIFTSNHNAPGLPGCSAAVANSCVGYEVIVGGNPTVQDLTGRRTQFAPKWDVSPAIQYDSPAFSGGWTALLRGTLHYASKVYTTTDDNPQSITGGNTLLGARLTFTDPSRSWTFSFFGENLSDVRYFTSKYPTSLDSAFGTRNPVNGTTLLRGYIGAPRTFGVRVGKTF